jgi:hypothetical protein
MVVPHFGDWFASVSEKLKWQSHLGTVLEEANIYSCALIHFEIHGFNF